MRVEKLLQTLTDDYKNNTVSLILATYLINIEKLPILMHLTLDKTGRTNVIY